MIYNNLGQMTEGRLVYFRSTDIEQMHWPRLLWSFPDEALYLMSTGERIIIQDRSTHRQGKIERVFVPVMRDILSYYLGIPGRSKNNNLSAHFRAASNCLESDPLLKTKYVCWKGKIREIKLEAVTIQVEREANPLNQANGTIDEILA